MAEKPTVRPGDVRDPKPVPVEEGSYAALLWDILGSRLGGDVLNSGISLPCWTYEPLTQLQRGSEVFEYVTLLDKAAEQKTSISRLAYVAVWAVSAFANTPERFKTNFNPILGETFELIDKRTKTPMKLFAEQTSHYPPESALVAETEEWRVIQNVAPKTEFSGNALDIESNSKLYVSFKLLGEEYHITSPKTKINNVCVGSMSIEHHGDLIVTNLVNNEVCTIKFEKSGFFGGINYDFKGYCKNTNGKDQIKLKGNWNTDASVEWLIEGEYKKGYSQEIWRAEVNDFKGQPYRLTKYANNLNLFPPELKQVLLPSDSRRRLDRFYLERGFSDYATDWKKVGEYRQREDHKERGQNKTNNNNNNGEKAAITSPRLDTSLSKKEQKKEHKKEKKENKDNKSHYDECWTPVWFVEGKDHNGKKMWKFSNTYWAIREEREKLIAENKDPGELYTPPTIKNTAADFAAYHSLWEGLLGKQTEDSNDKEKAEQYKKNLKAAADKDKK